MAGEQWKLHIFLNARLSEPIGGYANVYLAAYDALTYSAMGMEEVYSWRTSAIPHGIVLGECREYAQP